MIPEAGWKWYGGQGKLARPHPQHTRHTRTFIVIITDEIESFQPGFIRLNHPMHQPACFFSGQQLEPNLIWVPGGWVAYCLSAIWAVAVESRFECVQGCLITCMDLIFRFEMRHLIYHSHFMTKSLHSLSPRLLDYCFCILSCFQSTTLNASASSRIREKMPRGC